MLEGRYSRKLASALIRWPWNQKCEKEFLLTRACMQGKPMKRMALLIAVSNPEPWVHAIPFFELFFGSKIHLAPSVFAPWSMVRAVESVLCAWGGNLHGCRRPLVGLVLMTNKVAHQLLQLWCAIFMELFDLNIECLTLFYHGFFGGLGTVWFSFVCHQTFHFCGLLL